MALAIVACGQDPPGLETVKKAFDAQQIEAVDWREEVQDLYESAKQAGEDVPADISDWVAEDFGRIGAWEYATISVPAADLAGIQRILDAQGRERWECFHVLDRADEVVLMFKRRLRSYLGAVPLRELVRLVPLAPDLSGGEQ